MQLLAFGMEYNGKPLHSRKRIRCEEVTDNQHHHTDADADLPYPPEIPNMPEMDAHADSDPPYPTEMPNTTPSEMPTHQWSLPHPTFPEHQEQPLFAHTWLPPLPRDPQMTDVYTVCYHM